MAVYMYFVYIGDWSSRGQIHPGRRWEARASAKRDGMAIAELWRRLDSSPPVSELAHALLTRSDRHGVVVLAELRRDPQSGAWGLPKDTDR